jgi:hypothetical protein
VGDDEEEFEYVFEPVWRFFGTTLRDHLPGIPAKDELRAVFRDHREELWADAVAVSRVMLLGKIEGAVEPSLSGALLFHYLAEAIRNTELAGEDPDTRIAEASASEEVLTAQALLPERNASISAQSSIRCIRSPYEERSPLQRLS